ncbi:adenylosuccinate synthase [Propionivibrio sp.]|uniref:adenylosuccinate synthase n=1 Tax=Propionivibrio sp. TaxID=2212460 RepID=UPI0025FB62F1|nr:adenylosuccinate synthase [Propionivibrio sp.]MBK7356006.1 adenylosuccinate synthase [Propionivibrio sp.]MBK8400330.1 adenylosuccinate synthase [Propionivibrio sp.]MBK8743965.1 adenylosuccinate synthase [Propionivibrio sp.]MBK8892967.1 adenylosuccinate synthase [Propionivibrio sp.]
MAKNVVVVGTQWGDEGKGKIVDWLTDRAQGVVRFQGGHNAGHTLVVGQKVYKLNLVPSGIVHPGIKCYIGNGVVLDIQHLISEIEVLEAGGIDVRSRLRVSPGCPLILGYHSALDRAREAAKSSDTRIGTTGKGIGPTYEDKVARRALRVYDLFYPERFSEKLKENLDYHNFVLTRYLGAEAVDFNTVLEAAMVSAEQIKPMVVDVSAELHALNKAGQNLLFEGAQGALLDIDHGTYPFVTSSNCVAGQASAGAGIGPGMLHYVLGITKAYCTRVGGGPFPSELDIEAEGAPGRQMSRKGREIGTVTGRKRRCGWFDVPALKRSIQINGVTGLCITKLDVLDGLSELKLCTGYKLNGKVIDLLPMGSDEVADCQPVLESMTGWAESTAGVTTVDELPMAARAYLERIETLCDTRIDIISTGPERNETILRRHPYD